MRALRSTWKSTTLALAAALALAPLMATTASATTLVSSIPAAGAILNEAPSAVSLTTDIALLDQGNSITVTDPAGNRVDDGSLTIDGMNATIGLGGLTRSGMYKVTYNLVVDGDVPASGSYSFLFNAPSSISSPAATPTPTPTKSTKDSAPASGSNGGKIFVIILLVLSFFVTLFLIWYARMILRDMRDRKKPSKRLTPRSTRPKSE